VTPRPAYRDLPLLEPGADYRHAWQFYPPGDDLGTLAGITPEVRRRAVETVTTGTVVNLTLPLNLPDPPMFGRQRYAHDLFAVGRNNMDDRLDSFYPQGSTQWDGFRHVRARQFGFFTGHQGNFTPADTRLGIDHWAAAGIVGRGVLLDFSARYREDQQTPGDPGFDIDVAMLEAEARDVGIRPGDVLCIRTGWMGNYLASGPDERRRLAETSCWPGLAASADVAELLWDWGVAAVAADNPAVEVAPGSPAVGSLHRRLIPLLGMALGELFDFEGLAEECGRLGRREFLFTAVPLNLPGGVGSPGNALALF
jgi:kynurenine formamidase